MQVDSAETLKFYLDDIRKTNPINRKDEQQLFKMCRDGSRKARAALIQANMRFVLKVALQYRGCSIPLPDLVSEGAMGLIRAIESFDHSRGLKFISYAVWWIKAYITRAINENSSLIRIPANQHLRVRRALKDKTQNGELEDDIKELIQLCECGVSIDSPLKKDSKTNYSEILADPKSLNPEDKAEIEALEAMTQTLLSELPEREAVVLKGLFGINQKAPQTLREVGDSLNVSHERVRQLRDQAIKRMRRHGKKSALRERFQGYLELSSKMG